MWFMISDNIAWSEKIIQHCLLSSSRMVKLWTNYNTQLLLSDLTTAQFQPALVIHNYCHSQISFPATRSTPLSVNRYGTGPKGMIRNRIDYRKWTMVLVESKVYPGHKYLWNVDGGCFYSLLDEHVSWSPETKNNHLLRREKQFCEGIFFQHQIYASYLIIIFDFHDIYRGR